MQCERQVAVLILAVLSINETPLCLEMLNYNPCAFLSLFQNVLISKATVIILYTTTTLFTSKRR